MKKATRAVLLSALVFPGAGHIGLDHYLRGSVLMLASLSAAFVIVKSAIQRATSLLQGLNGGETIDPGSITDMVMNTAGNSGGLAEKSAVSILVLCWLIGIIDSYRLGAAADRDASQGKDK
jgi:hypothetical protein